MGTQYSEGSQNPLPNAYSEMPTSTNATDVFAPSVAVMRPTNSMAEPMRNCGLRLPSLLITTPPTRQPTRPMPGNATDEARPASSFEKFPDSAMNMGKMVATKE